MHGVNGLSSDKQPGIHLSKSGFPRVVPSGYTPQEHFEAAKQLKVHPLDTPRDLAIDLEWALEASTAEPSSIVGQRRRHLHWLETKAKTFKAFNMQAVAAMSERVRIIAGQVNVGLMLFFVYRVSLA